MAVKFGKNSWGEERGQVVRVTLGEYRGAQKLHVRVWAEIDDGRWVPTKRGLSLRPQMWAALLPEIEAKVAEWREKASEGSKDE